MPVAVAIAGVAVSAIAAKKQSDAAKKATRAGQQAAQQGMDYQRERDGVFDQNIQGYLGAGQTGIDGMQGLLNDPNSIQQSNAYKFRFDQGQQSLDRGAAARGGLYGGGHTADTIKFGQGMASQEFDNQWNRFAGMADRGQNAAVGAGNMGQQSANAMSRMYGDQGFARGQGSINSANAFSNGLQGAMGAFGQFMGSRKSGYQPTQQPSFGGFAPNQSGFSGGQLGPSNGKTWNFGGDR